MALIRVFLLVEGDLVLCLVLCSPLPGKLISEFTAQGTTMRVTVLTNTADSHGAILTVITADSHGAILTL